MTRDDVKDILRRSSSAYEQMLAERAMERVAEGDAKAHDALGGLIQYKGAAAIPVIVDLASKVAPPGPIGAEHLQAAIQHQYPAEAFQILRDAMKRA